MTRYGDWHRRVICSCGWHAKATALRGEVHVNVSCCPACGSDKDKWTVATMRIVCLSGSWFPWRRAEEHWETLKQRAAGGKEGE